MPRHHGVGSCHATDEQWLVGTHRWQQLVVRGGHGEAGGGVGLQAQDSAEDS